VEPGGQGARGQCHLRVRLLAQETPVLHLPAGKPHHLEGEITTGSRRIHEYKMLLDNNKLFGLKPEGLSDYLSIFKYGCPPHGGFAIGLERLTYKVLGLVNVKEACLFPRDRRRIRP